MKSRNCFHLVAASVIGLALVAGLTAPSEAQFGRSSRSSRGSTGGRGSSGFSRGGATTRPTTQVAATPVTAAHPDWNYYDQVVVQENIFMKRRVAPRSGDGLGRPNPPPPPINNWVLRGTVLEADNRVAFFENEGSGATIRVHTGESVGGTKVLDVESEFVEIAGRSGTRHVNIGGTLTGEAAGVVRGGGILGGTGGTGGASAEAGAGGPAVPESGSGADNADAGPAPGDQSIFVDEGPADGGMVDTSPGAPAPAPAPGGDEAAPADNGGADNGPGGGAPLSPEDAILERMKARRAQELNK